MATMASFVKILEALGAYDIAEASSHKHWTFYTAKYRTPAGEHEAGYLSLNYECPLSEGSLANKAAWRRLTKANWYTAVVTAKSPLAANLDRTSEVFGSKTATTSRRLLAEYVLQGIMPSTQIDDYEYFIEPDIFDSSGKDHHALQYLVRRLTGDDIGAEREAIATILVAPAGLGKTTLSRSLVKRFLDRKELIIPVLVESAQWQNLINLTLPNVLNAALLQIAPSAGRLTNPELFQLLVREQLLVPIFDGFDELCLHPNSNYTPSGLISDLLDLVGDAGAHILITTRETFWEKYQHVVPSERISISRLKGFSNIQRKNFFRKRLKDDSNRDVANRIASTVSSGLYGKAIGEEGERAKGIPLLLELIALYCDQNDQATFAPGDKDPMGHLLLAFCERENVRQKLNIESSVQMEIFEELFKDFPGDIKRDDLRLYVEDKVPTIQADALARFESHAFLAPGEHLRPRFEALRVYFIARWLANRLLDAEGKPMNGALPEVLEQNAYGGTDVFDFLIDRFVDLEPSKVRAAIRHACEMISVRAVWQGAFSALFHLVDKIANSKLNNKKERTKFVLDHLCMDAGKHELKNAAIYGQISGLDFSGLRVEGCSFKDLEFRNCAFDEETAFINCEFTGELHFESCQGAGKSQRHKIVCSDAAEAAWSKAAGRVAAVVITESLARSAFREILRKFVGQFGINSIKDADKNSGAIGRNIARDAAWAALIKHGIIGRHEISGVSEGGLHIIDEPEVRHEVRSFIDNAALGPKLAGALQTLVSGR